MKEKMEREFIAMILTHVGVYKSLKWLINFERGVAMGALNKHNLGRRGP